MPKSTDRKLSTASRVVYVVLLTLIGTAVLADVFWIAYRRHISIGVTTTRITKPIGTGGVVNYRLAINQRTPKSLCPADNAAIELFHALGAGMFVNGAARESILTRLGMRRPPKNGPFFVSFNRFCRQHATRPVHTKAPPRIFHLREALYNHPFSARRHLRTAGWLHANAVALRWTLRAAQRPCFYIPLPPRRTEAYFLSLAPLPYVTGIQRLAGALTQRAMLELHRGELAACRRDLLAAHRLARLLGQGPFLDERVAARYIELRTIGADWTFIRCAHLSAAAALDYARDLAGLPPLRPLAGAINYAGRWAALDYIQWQSEDWFHRHCVPHEMDGPIDWSILLPPDYAARMMRVNYWYDRFVAAFRKSNCRLREQALAGVQVAINQACDLGEGPRADLYLALTLENLHPLVSLAARVRSAQRMTRVVLALAAYRRRHGRYPKTLACLVPTYLPKMPLDAFTGKPLHYIAAGGKCGIFSVGEFHGLSTGALGSQKNPEMVVQLKTNPANHSTGPGA